MHREEDQVEDQNLMFFHDSLKEVSRPIVALQEDTLSTKLMPDGRVFKPIKVFTEGTYVSTTRSGKPIELVVTKERMERWVKNTIRDIPFNFDHKREPGPNNLGWLRTRTGQAYVAPDPETGKYALYAQPEFTEQLYSLISNGRYRDVSLEIDTQDDVLVGIAVTNYPRVKTLTQMSEILPEEEVKKQEADEIKNLNIDMSFKAWVSNFSEEDEEAFKIKVQEALSTVSTEMKASDAVEVIDSTTEIVDNAEKVKEDIVTDQERLELEAKLAEMEAKFSELQAKAAMLEAEKAANERKAKRAQLVLDMSQKADKLILSEKGESFIPAGSREDVIELFCYLAEHNDDVLFSDMGEEKQINPVDLFERILSSIAKFSDVMTRTEHTQRVNVSDETQEDERIREQLRALYANKIRTQS